jgi:peptidoglycan/LPS O-acetylase OafA/YrhL
MAEKTSTTARARNAGPIHLRHVEGIRALAALVVYVNHVYGQTWNCGQGQFPPGRILSLFTYSLVAGHLAVAVFIVVSGFCLTLPVVKNEGELRGGTKAFLWRRARRILPPYYAAVALCLLLIWTVMGKPTGTLWDVPIRATWVSVVAHVILVQDLFATSHINYVFWSIATEWQIYWLFPLLVWLWRRYGAIVAVSMALLVGYALRLGLADTRVVRSSPHFIGLFALGMLAAYLARSTGHGYEKLRERIPWGAVALSAFAIDAALCGAWGWSRSVDRFYILDLFTGIGAMALLVHTSGPTPRRATDVLAWKPLVVIGTFSYSVYLIHAPLIQVFWQFLLHPAHLAPVPMFFALMGPCALATLALSYGFFRLFEEPFMRRRASETASPDQVRAGLAAQSSSP